MKKISLLILVLMVSSVALGSMKKEGGEPFRINTSQVLWLKEFYLPGNFEFEKLNKDQRATLALWIEYKLTEATSEKSIREATIEKKIKKVVIEENLKKATNNIYDSQGNNVLHMLFLLKQEEYELRIARVLEKCLKYCTQTMLHTKNNVGHTPLDFFDLYNNSRKQGDWRGIEKFQKFVCQCDLVSSNQSQSAPTSGHAKKKKLCTLAHPANAYSKSVV